jgi:hypothetical protein
MIFIKILYISPGGLVIDIGDFCKVQDTYFMTPDRGSTERVEVSTLFIIPDLY